MVLQYEFNLTNEQLSSQIQLPTSSKYSWCKRSLSPRSLTSPRLSELAISIGSQHMSRHGRSIGNRCVSPQNLPTADFSDLELRTKRHSSPFGTSSPSTKSRLANLLGNDGSDRFVLDVVGSPSSPSKASQRLGFALQNGIEATIESNSVKSPKFIIADLLKNRKSELLSGLSFRGDGATLRISPRDDNSHCTTDKQPNHVLRLIESSQVVLKEIESQQDRTETNRTDISRKTRQPVKLQRLRTAANRTYQVQTPSRRAATALTSTQSSLSVKSTWLNRIFTTKSELPRKVISSDDVVLAEEIQRLREYIASQLTALPPAKREIIKYHGLKSLRQVVKDRWNGDSRQISLGDIGFCSGSPSLFPFPAISTSYKQQQTPFPRFEHWTNSCGLESRFFPAVEPSKVNNSQLQSSPPPLNRVLPLTTARTFMTAPHLSSCSSSTNLNEFLHPDEDTPSANVFDQEYKTRWEGSATFVVSLAAGLVGQSNLARFPYFLYFYNGLPFIIGYLIIGTFVVIPTMSLLIGLGQMVQGGSFRAIDALHPRARGLTVIMSFLSFISAVIQSFDVAYLLVYLTKSFSEHFAWRPTPLELLQCFRVNILKNPDTCSLGGLHCTYNKLKQFCAVNSISYAMSFYETVNLASDGNTLAATFVSLIVVWLSILAVAMRGVACLYSVAVWSLSATIVVFIFLLAFGSSLPGAGYALRFLFGLSDIKNPYLWSFAIIQGLSSTSVASTLLVGLASHNKPKQSVYAAASMAFYLDFFISCLVGLAVFPFLGFLRVDPASFGLLEITKSPEYMVWSVIPSALSFLPGAPVFCALYFVSTILVSLNGSFAQIAIVAEDWASIRWLGTKFSKMVIVIVLVVVGILITISHFIKPMDKYWWYFNYTHSQIAVPTIVVLLCIVAAWADSWELQARNIGKLSVLTFFLSFFVLLSLAILFHTTYEDMWLSHSSRLDILIVTGFVLCIICLIMAYVWRWRLLCNTCARETKWQCLGQSTWWLFFGGVQMLRADINDITIGAPPYTTSSRFGETTPSRTEQEEDMIKKAHYGRGFWCIGSQRMPVYWGLFLKYVVPIACVFSIIFQIRHICGHSPGDPVHGTIVFGGIMLEKRDQEQFKFCYITVLALISSLSLFFWICPGFLSCVIPKVRVTHRRVWQGHYERPWKRWLQDTLGFTTELNKPHWTTTEPDDDILLQRRRRFGRTMMKGGRLGSRCGERCHQNDPDEEWGYKTDRGEMYPWLANGRFGTERRRRKEIQLNDDYDEYDSDSTSIGGCGLRVGSQTTRERIRKESSDNDNNNEPYIKMSLKKGFSLQKERK